MNDLSYGMKWRVDDVPIFLAVVEHNGISAAARALEIPKSSVSLALKRLEQAFALRLFDRNSRNLRLTNEGQSFYRSALRIREEVREADAKMAGMNAVPTGRITVSLPPAFCEEFVAPHLPEFHAMHPSMTLDLKIQTTPLDLLREAIDVAIVVGPWDDSELISRTLISGRLRWVASPAYRANSQPIGDSVEDLLQHIRLCETRYGQSNFPIHVNGQPKVIDLSRGITHVNHPLVVRRAIMNGAGISLLPETYCNGPIAKGSLVEVFQHIVTERAASRLTVVYPARRWTPPTTRAFLEFLERICPGFGA